jgi:hypothetical protein
MNPEVLELLAGCTVRDGASLEILEQLRASMPIRLPSDYLSLLSWSDGVDGFVGENYRILYTAEVVRTHGVREYAPAYIFIGSDGGGEGFAYDTRTPDLLIANVPFIGADEPPRILGRSILEFLQRLHDKPLFE